MSRLVSPIPDVGIADQVAEHVRRLGDLPGEHPSWPRRVLDDGRIPPVRGCAIGTPGAVPRDHAVPPAHLPEVARGVTDVFNARKQALRTRAIPHPTCGCTGDRDEVL